MNITSHMRGVFSKSRRIISALTAALFTFTNVLSAQGPADLSLASPTPARIEIPDRITIPDDLGTIQEEHRNGNGSPFIVFIQDAHVVVDAQVNIEELIKHVGKEYGIRLVALEGGKGRLDPTLLRTFPEAGVKRRVMEDYREQGEVTGAEMASIFEERKGIYYGIEDWDLYERNYVAYLRASQRREKVLEELGEMRVGLDRKRRRVYGKELNKFHEKVQGFRNEEVHLLELLKYLKSRIERASAKRQNAGSRMRVRARGVVPASQVLNPLSGFRYRETELEKLFASIERDEAMNAGELEGEIRELAEGLKKRHETEMKKEELMGFNGKFQDYMTGNLDAASYLKYLIQAGERVGEKVKLSRMMQELLGHQETLSTIRGTKVFEELEALIQEMEEQMLRTEKQRAIAEKYKKARVVRDLAKLELTRDQLEKYQKDRDGYRGLLKDGRWLDAAEEFYRLAVERDEALQRNLADLLKQENEKAAVVLAGGFHSEGFARGLKEKGYSYVVVTPRIRSLRGHERYEEVMLGKLSYKEYLEKSFYDAFVKHSTMKMVSELDGPEFRKVLKEWRDNVVRKLAEEGRVAESGEYTKYIDFLVKVYVEKYGVEGLTEKSKEEILKDIGEELARFQEGMLARIRERFEDQLGRFMKGIRGLIDRNQLTEEKIEALILEVGRTKSEALAASLGNLTPGLQYGPLLGKFLETGDLSVLEAIPETTPGEVLEALDQRRLRDSPVERLMSQPEVEQGVEALRLIGRARTPTNGSAQVAAAVVDGLIGAIKEKLPEQAKKEVIEGQIAEALYRGLEKKSEGVGPMGGADSVRAGRTRADAAPQGSGAAEIGKQRPREGVARPGILPTRVSDRENNLRNLPRAAALGEASTQRESGSVEAVPKISGAEQWEGEPPPVQTRALMPAVSYASLLQKSFVVAGLQSLIAIVPLFLTGFSTRVFIMTVPVLGAILMTFLGKALFQKSYSPSMRVGSYQKPWLSRVALLILAPLVSAMMIVEGLQSARWERVIAERHEAPVGNNVWNHTLDDIAPRETFLLSRLSFGHPGRFRMGPAGRYYAGLQIIYLKDRDAGTITTLPHEAGHHFVRKKLSQEAQQDLRDVARRQTAIAEEIRKQNPVRGPYWIESFTREAAEEAAVELLAETDREGSRLAKLVEKVDPSEREAEIRQAKRKLAEYIRNFRGRDWNVHYVGFYGGTIHLESEPTEELGNWAVRHLLSQVDFYGEPVDQVYQRHLPKSARRGQAMPREPAVLPEGAAVPLSIVRGQALGKQRVALTDTAAPGVPLSTDGKVLGPDIQRAAQKITWGQSLRNRASRFLYAWGMLWSAFNLFLGRLVYVLTGFSFGIVGTYGKKGQVIVELISFPYSRPLPAFIRRRLPLIGEPYLGIGILPGSPKDIRDALRELMAPANLDRLGVGKPGGFRGFQILTNQPYFIRVAEREMRRELRDIKREITRAERRGKAPARAEPAWSVRPSSEAPLTVRIKFWLQQPSNWLGNIWGIRGRDAHGPPQLITWEARNARVVSRPITIEELKRAKFQVVGREVFVEGPLIQADAPTSPMEGEGRKVISEPQSQPDGGFQEMKRFYLRVTLPDSASAEMPPEGLSASKWIFVGKGTSLEQGNETISLDGVAYYFARKAAGNDVQTQAAFNRSVLGEVEVEEFLRGNQDAAGDNSLPILRTVDAGTRGIGVAYRLAVGPPGAKSLNRLSPGELPIRKMILLEQAHMRAHKRVQEGGAILADRKPGNVLIADDDALGPILIDLSNAVLWEKGEKLPYTDSQGVTYTARKIRNPENLPEGTFGTPGFTLPATTFQQLKAEAVRLDENRDANAPRDDSALINVYRFNSLHEHVRSFLVSTGVAPRELFVSLEHPEIALLEEGYTGKEDEFEKTKQELKAQAPIALSEQIDRWASRAGPKWVDAMSLLSEIMQLSQLKGGILRALADAAEAPEDLGVLEKAELAGLSGEEKAQIKRMWEALVTERWERVDQLLGELAQIPFGEERDPAKREESPQFDPRRFVLSVMSGDIEGAQRELNTVNGHEELTILEEAARVISRNPILAEASSQAADLEPVIALKRAELGARKAELALVTPLTEPRVLGASLGASTAGTPGAATWTGVLEPSAVTVSPAVVSVEAEEEIEEDDMKKKAARLEDFRRQNELERRTALQMIQAAAAVDPARAPWVIFSDMMKLSLRDTVYGSKAADLLIMDVIEIARGAMKNYGGTAYRIGDGADEVGIVLPGALSAGDVEGILAELQERIEDEFRGRYAFARLPADMAWSNVPFIREQGAVRSIQRLAHLVRDESGKDVAGEDSPYLFFRVDEGSGARATLNRILKGAAQRAPEASQPWFAGVLESRQARIQPMLVPYTPAGAIRMQAADGTRDEGWAERTLERSLGEAWKYQAQAKEQRLLHGVAGLMALPEDKGAEKPLMDKGTERGVDEELKRNAQQFEKFPFEIEGEYAVFLRSQLYSILKSVMEQPQGEMRTYLIRGPPDSFYVVTAGQKDRTAPPRWQITLVKQVIASKNQATEDIFNAILAASGRQPREKGKFGFKVVNDHFGRTAGNQLIKLDSLHLRQAFQEQVAVHGSLLAAENVLQALQGASEKIGEVTSKNGFGVEFEATTFTIDDLVHLPRIRSPAAVLTAPVLGRLEQLAEVRIDQSRDVGPPGLPGEQANPVKRRDTGRFPAASVKAFTDNSSEAVWDEIKSQIRLANAHKRARARSELYEAHGRNDAAAILRDSSEISMALDSLAGNDKKLREQLSNLLIRQHIKTSQISLLPPNLPHIARVIQNARNLMLNENLRQAMEAIFGPENALRVAEAVALLSKIGFAHDNLNPRQRSTYKENRKFALEILTALRNPMTSALGLNPEQFDVFLEAIQREGTFGIGTEMAPDKYKNPLTALLTVASEADISQQRLAEWQANAALTRALIRISADPDVASLYAERASLEMQKGLAVLHGVGHRVKKIEERVERNRREFERVLKGLIGREILGKRDRMIKELVAEGHSPRASEELYDEMVEKVQEIDSESYLWHVSSYGIQESGINQDGQLVVLGRRDQGTLLGAAAQLSHVREFHPNRLRSVLGHVNAGQGTKIELSEEITHPDDVLHQFIQNNAKADTHTHLKMAVDFDLYIWNGTIVNFDYPVREYREVIGRSQKLMNELRERRGLPPNIDLVDNIRRVRNAARILFKFIHKHDPDYKMPKDKDYLAEDAQKWIVKLGSELTADERDTIRQARNIYLRLKFTISNLFNFQEGDLTLFVPHFMAASNLHKVTEQDEFNKLKATTKAVLANYQQDNVRYFEPRFNIGSSKEATLREILTVIQAYKEWVAEQEMKNKESRARGESERMIPEIKIITSITKFADALDKPLEKRIQHKTDSARILMDILREARQRRDAGNQPYEPIRAKDGTEIVSFAGEHSVAPQDVLDYVAGIDAAGQEETNPPSLFFDAFRILEDYRREIEEYNRQKDDSLKVGELGGTFHVSESISDVSVESGIRHTLDAIFMRFFETVDDSTRAVLERIGHGIVIALVDYVRLKGTTKAENWRERVEQIQHDLALLKRGIPLLAVTREGLEQELAELKRHAEGIHAVRTQLERRLEMRAEERQVLEQELAQLEAREVTYVYDTDEKIRDLETRAGFVRDQLIRYGIVVEKNPTSNVGISPYITGYADHPLKRYLKDPHAQWAKDLIADTTTKIEALRATERNTEEERQLEILIEARDKARDYLKSQEARKHEGKKVRVTINTDDLTLFGTDETGEIETIATALDLSMEQVADLMEEGFRSRIGQRSLRAEEQITAEYRGIRLGLSLDRERRRIPIVVNLSKKDAVPVYVGEGKDLAFELSRRELEALTGWNGFKRVSQISALPAGRGVHAEVWSLDGHEELVAKRLEAVLPEGTSPEAAFEDQMNLEGTAGFRFEDAIRSLEPAVQKGLVARFAVLQQKGGPRDGQTLILQRTVALSSSREVVANRKKLAQDLARLITDLAALGLSLKTNIPGSDGNVLKNIGRVVPDSQLMVSDFLNLERVTPRRIPRDEALRMSRVMIRDSRAASIRSHAATPAQEREETSAASLGQGLRPATTRVDLSLAEGKAGLGRTAKQISESKNLLVAVTGKSPRELARILAGKKTARQIEETLRSLVVSQFNQYESALQSGLGGVSQVMADAEDVVSLVMVEDLEARLERALRKVVKSPLLSKRDISDLAMALKGSVIGEYHAVRESGVQEALKQVSPVAQASFGKNLRAAIRSFVGQPGAEKYVAAIDNPDPEDRDIVVKVLTQFSGSMERLEILQDDGAAGKVNRNDWPRSEFPQLYAQPYGRTTKREAVSQIIRRALGRAPVFAFTQDRGFGGLVPGFGSILAEIQSLPKNQPGLRQMAYGASVLLVFRLGELAERNPRSFQRIMNDSSGEALRSFIERDPDIAFLADRGFGIKNGSVSLNVFAFLESLTQAAEETRAVRRAA